MRWANKNDGCNRQPERFYNKSSQILSCVSLFLRLTFFLTGFRQIRDEAVAAGCPLARESVWLFFVNKCANNLHIVLAMSPVGETLRTRCRNFPGDTLHIVLPGVWYVGCEVKASFFEYDGVIFNFLPRWYVASLRKMLCLYLPQSIHVNEYQMVAPLRVDSVDEYQMVALSRVDSVDEYQMVAPSRLEKLSGYQMVAPARDDSVNWYQIMAPPRV